MEPTKKCPWCGGELFRVYGAMNYPWDYSCSKCNGYCFERDILYADEQRKGHHLEYAERVEADRKRGNNVEQMKGIPWDDD